MRLDLRPWKERLLSERYSSDAVPRYVRGLPDETTSEGYIEIARVLLMLTKGSSP